MDASLRTRLIRLERNVDERGELVVAEIPDGLPFTPARIFVVTGVPTGETRGVHAHRACHQFLICGRGRVSVAVDEGGGRSAQVMLDSTGVGLWMPPLVWGGQTYLDHDSLLIVAASDVYDAEDYITDYGEFEAALAETSGSS